MYRSGVPGIYANDTYTKFASQRVENFFTCRENAELVHGNREISRNDGRIEIGETVDFSELLDELVGPP
jgi:hypothetical protein